MPRKRSKHVCPKCRRKTNHLHRELRTQELLCYWCDRDRKKHLNMHIRE